MIKSKSFILMIVCLVLLFSGISFAEGREVIQNKRVAIFFEEGFPCRGVKPLFWYQKCLKDFGVDVTVAGTKELCDTKFLTKSNIDTLILLDGKNIPLEAMYTLLNFLSEGGNVITCSLPEYGIKYDSEKKGWGDRVWLQSDKNRNEFQIRYLRWERRGLNCSLKVNPDIPSFLELPSIVGPFNTNYNLLDKMNYYKVMPKGWHTGDGAYASKKNIDTAGNIIFPVYLLPGGEPADFVAYRYHSNYFNGSTLVILGRLGSSLLNTIFAEDILYTSLKLCEMKLPGEEEVSYYERLIKLQRKTSEFSMLFMEIRAYLRDLTFKKFYKGEKEYEELKNKMCSCEESFTYIIGEKEKIDSLLTSGSDTKVQDRRRKELLTRIEKETERLHAIKKNLAKEIRKLEYPGEVKIKSPLGGIVIDAGITIPIGLYMLRKDFFQSMKELGVNTYYPQWSGRTFGLRRAFYHYLDDPIIKKNREGIKFDLYFTPSCNLGEILPSQGTLNPNTGKVTETKRNVYNYKSLEKRIKAFVEAWKNEPVLRCWTHHEAGLGFKFWGEQAREEYQEYLKGKYKDINLLNERWNTNYKKFEEIKLLTKQPATITEHGNWEDWTNFREQILVSAFQFHTDVFKKYAPEILISHMPASNSILHPLYGINFYQITKTQGLSGIDGLYGRLPEKREWIWFDLNCGKPVFTAEWSMFYGQGGSMLSNRKSLCQGVWSEVSGGAVGINCWIWRLHGYRRNYVDTTGLPTLLGWELKSLVSDLNKFDHIILDGKRKEPEIRILFSDTSRCHDYDWYVGRKSPSPHVQATMDAYLLFLKSHQPARVIAEEAILEGADLSNCKILIVPQAEYLSEELQETMIDYVKNGGNLLLEGNAGKFDNYGHPQNLLFKEAGVVPSSVEKREILLPEGETFFVKKGKAAFSPLLIFPGGKGKVLLSYASGEPALVSVPVGKGKILVSGMSFILPSQQENAVHLIMEEIRKEVILPAKYICSDEDLVIREWEYNGSDYLICAYPKGKKSLINRFLMKVRGKYEVIDYLIGAKIPSRFDGEYTSFSGLITSPGGRVYELKKTSLKKISLSLDFRLDSSHKVEKQGLTPKSTSLLYKGGLYEDEPKEINGFVFQVNINASADRMDVGEAYLIVSKGKERLKRNVEQGKEYLFSFKETTFLVKCIAYHFVFPLHIEVEIKKVERRAISSSCSFQKEGNKLLLANGLVKLKIIPKEGGRIAEYSTLHDEVDHLAAGYGIEEYADAYPAGRFTDAPFSYKLIEDSKEKIKISLKMNNPVVKNRHNLLLKKLITIVKNEAKVNLEIQEYNYGSVSDALSLGLHPALKIGGEADSKDTFFIPTSEGLKTFPYIAGAGNYYFTPAEGWACCCDKEERIAYIASFPKDEVETVYIWMGLDSYNLELLTPKRKIEPLKAISLHTDLFFIKGISGVSSFKEGVSAYISLPEMLYSQDKDIGFTVEIGSAFLEKKKLKGKLSLLKQGKRIKKLGKFSEDVSFEKSLEKSFSFSVKDLPDGEYEISLSISTEREKQFLNVGKILFLIGKEKERNLAVYEELKKKINKLREKYPSKREEIYNLFSLLEEFRIAIEEGKRDKILLKRKAVEDIFRGRQPKR